MVLVQAVADMCFWSLVLLVAVVSGQPATAAGLEARINAIAAGFRGRIGVFAKNLESGETVAINADERFPTASVIKLAVLVEAYQQIEQGKLKASDHLVLHDSDKVGIGDSGTVNELHDGTELTIQDLLNLMVVVSDNTATNLLVGRIGTAAANARMGTLGLKNTRIFRPTFRDGHPDCCPELEHEFGLGMSTPRDMGILMELIATGRAVGSGASKQMFEILRRQQDTNMIPRRLPGNAGVIVANKTGTDEEKQPDASGFKGHIHNDVAIVKTPGATWVLAIFTRRGQSPYWTAENEALTTGAEISKAVYETWK
ncbi:MAG: serine hydrolase [Acidobacteriota bacterium]